jgi:hypothetical protein
MLVGALLLNRSSVLSGRTANTAAMPNASACASNKIDPAKTNAAEARLRPQRFS